MVKLGALALVDGQRINRLVFRQPLARDSADGTGFIGKIYERRKIVRRPDDAGVAVK